MALLVALHVSKLKHFIIIKNEGKKGVQFILIGHWRCSGADTGTIGRFEPR